MIDRIQIPGRVPSAIFSHVVRWGDLVFVSGQVSRDDKGQKVGVGDFKRQAEQVFENVKQALTTAGSSLDRVLKVTIFITDARYRDQLRDVNIRYMGQHLPASTLVVVAGLSEPEYLIEIEAIAAGLERKP